MLRIEWENIINKKLSDGDWDTLNMVYMWHPMMPDKSINAREKCKNLYDAFGVGIFYDMEQTARDMMDAQSEIDSCKQHIAEAVEEFNEANAKAQHRLNDIRISNSITIQALLAKQAELEARYD